MGILEKIKGLLKGRETQVKSGIDKGSDTIEKKVGTQHAGKVDDMSDRAKDAVDKLSPSEPASRPATTPTVAQTPTAATPPSSTPPPATPPVP